MNWKFWGKNNKVESMSFQETFDLVGLPIITFKQNDKKFNFILDTGSVYSVINKTMLRRFTHSKSQKGTATCCGVEGNTVEAPFIEATVVYRDIEFTDDFQVMDMSKAFEQLKSSYGVNIHGILGAGFMNKYKYVIDFDKLIAYTKK